VKDFKGTPGPWTGMKLTECLPLAHCDQVGLSIGFVNSSSEARMQEGKANARLIAAAPDLLEAVQGLLICMRLAGWEDDAMAVQARKAIAKALGESK